MRINNIGYLLKEGIKGIFLHGFMSFAAVCVTLACLLIMGIFASVMYNINILVKELNQTNEVIVYIDETLTDSQARSIETQIRPMDNVLSATFVTREQALKDFIADHEGDSAFSGVDAETLRHRVVVVLEDNALMEDTIEQLRGIKGVADISAAHKLAKGFATIQHILQVVFIAVLILFNLVLPLRRVKTQSDSLSAHDLTMQVRMDTMALRVKLPKGGENWVLWCDVDHVYEREDFVEIVHNKNASLYIPKRVIDDLPALDAVIKRCRGKQ